MKKTLDKSFVKCYSQKFEESKYPYEPYNKIVWGRIESNNKYSILGALFGFGYNHYEYSIQL